MVGVARGLSSSGVMGKEPWGGGQESAGKKLARATELQFGAGRVRGPEQGDTREQPRVPLGTGTSAAVGPLRLSPILSALLSLLGIIKENGCFPEPGPGPSALPALPKSLCNKFIGITLPSPNPGPSPPREGFKRIRARPIINFIKGEGGCQSDLEPFS